jgi:hypothetical protein
LTRLPTKSFRRFTSPLQKLAAEYMGGPEKALETIDAFPMPPWEERLPVVIERDREKAAEAAKSAQGLIFAISTAVKNERIGYGGAFVTLSPNGPLHEPVGVGAGIGLKSSQNPYTAELAAIAKMLQQIPDNMKNTQVRILSNNQAALRAIGHPQQQPGQMHIRKIYEAIRRAKEQNNSFKGIWRPAEVKNAVCKLAKKKAKLATQPGGPTIEQLPDSKQAFLSTIRAGRGRDRSLPKDVGRYSKELDAALPGKHTRMLYNNLKRDESRTLAQLRTGMSQLNEYLYRIGAKE